MGKAPPDMCGSQDIRGERRSIRMMRDRNAMRPAIDLGPGLAGGNRWPASFHAKKAGLRATRKVHHG